MPTSFFFTDSTWMLKESWIDDRMIIMTSGNLLAEFNESSRAYLYTCWWAGCNWCSGDSLRLQKEDVEAWRMAQYRFGRKGEAALRLTEQSGNAFLILVPRKEKHGLTESSVSCRFSKFYGTLMLQRYPGMYLVMNKSFLC